MRRALLLLAALLAFAVSATASTPTRVKCPIKPGTPTGGDVQWSFGDSTPAVYVHGHGTWTNGQATGMICMTRGPQSVVLAVGSASSKLQTATAGADVVLTLPVSVSASGESSCAVGAHGSVTLYAHYHVTGVDTARVHLTSACAGENHSYGGSTLHMLITRHGAHV